MAQSMKQIVTEIWKRKGKNADGSEHTIGGKDIIEIVNRESGKIETYQKIREVTKPSIIAYPKGNAKVSEDYVDTEEYYGQNGFFRVRFAEAVIAEQTEIPTDFDRD
jgi:hypothetical protein